MGLYENVERCTEIFNSNHPRPIQNINIILLNIMPNFKPNMGCILISIDRSKLKIDSECYTDKNVYYLCGLRRIFGGFTNGKKIKEISFPWRRLKISI